MKKLSLKNLKLEANDMLQRNQLKTVFGGYGGYDDGQGCSIEATAAVFNENAHYGPMSHEETQAAKMWYYESCMAVGHDNWDGPIFL